MSDYPRPPFPPQSQDMPGTSAAMQPRPDCGESSYKGCGRLQGKKAVITGGIVGSGAPSRSPMPAKVPTS